jgi:hypothetical protein
LFAEKVVEETEFAVGDLYATRGVDGLIDWELDSFDQVEGDGILQAAKCLGY